MPRLFWFDQVVTTQKVKTIYKVPDRNETKTIGPIWNLSLSMLIIQNRIKALEVIGSVPTLYRSEQLTARP